MIVSAQYFTEGDLDCCAIWLADLDQTIPTIPRLISQTGRHGSRKSAREIQA